MSLQLQFESREFYLYAQASGQYSLSAVMSAFQQVMAESISRGHQAVMVDVRSIDGAISFGDRFEFGAGMAQVLVGNNIHLAFMCRPDQVTPDRFLESVAINRGAWLKVATDMNDALHWLSLSTQQRTA